MNAQEREMVRRKLEEMYRAKIIEIEKGIFNDIEKKCTNDEDLNVYLNATLDVIHKCLQSVNDPKLYEMWAEAFYESADELAVKFGIWKEERK